MKNFMTKQLEVEKLYDWLETHPGHPYFSKMLERYEQLSTDLIKQLEERPNQRPLGIRQDKNGNWFDARHFNGDPEFKQLEPLEGGELNDK